MILHLRPRLFSPFSEVKLVDLRIEPFGLCLNEKQLATRRPYPNKRYAVACRRQGNRAIDGILIETQPVEELDLTARWAVEAHMIVTHQVHYKLLDRDFEAASDDMVLWYGFRDWSSRWPEWAEGLAPVKAQPVMEVVPREEQPFEERPSVHGTEDIFNDEGLVVTRRQCFEMPTIEPERLFCSELNDRVPGIEAAFRL